MISPKLLVRLVLFLVMLNATPYAEAQGRPACAERGRVVERLAQAYGETLHSMGLRKDNELMEIFASDQTGSWTILMTKTDGTSCLLAAGKAWEGGARSLTRPGKDA